MSKNIATRDVVDWLLEGDPSVAWQTMRDVVGAPEAKWRPVRERVATEGWGRRLLELRDKKKGTWGHGIYAPKWISTTYTLLLLRDMGLPQDNAAGHKGASLLLGGGTESKLAGRVDLCVIAMYQTLMAYFGVNDERIDLIIRHLLSRQMADGGWNCSERRHVVTHGSLHSTISVLESLAQYAQAPLFHRGHNRRRVNSRAGE